MSGTCVTVDALRFGLWVQVLQYTVWDSRSRVLGLWGGQMRFRVLGYEAWVYGLKGLGVWRSGN